jgi:hypothetical protein
LNSRSNSPETEHPKEFSAFFRSIEIFRSWFWRFYDHFFQLILYNFFWIFSCFGVSWLFARFNFFKVTKKTDFFWLFLIFVIETIVSLGWAHLIFKVFIYGEGSLKDVWGGIKKYIFKATGVSVISVFFIALAFFNIRFYFFLNTPHRFIDFMCIGFIFWVLLFWLLGSIYYWPILFFQDPPFLTIFYKAFLLALGNCFVSVEILGISFAFMILFSTVWPLWFFFGGALLFSLQCVALEKQLLMYKITYGNKSLEVFLEFLDCEQRRGWRELFRPWENR